jgi:diguanylate cyclase (GGDEF)-like protein
MKPERTRPNGMQRQPEAFDADRDAALVGLLIAGFEACNMPAILYDPDDNLIYMTPSHRELFGLPEDIRTFRDFIWHNCNSNENLITTLPPEEWLAMAQAKRRVHQHRSFEIDMEDGRWFIINETTLEGGWLFNILTEITSLKSNERTLRQARDAARRAAETDPLTGLYNRRFALEQLQREIDHCTADNSPLSIALIDLDRFKSINDTYGHATGDAVLCHFATCASDVLRSGDIFARFGGEEFLLILPGNTEADTAEVINRLFERVAKADLQAQSVRYTFSAGIATCDGKPMNRVLENADRALYKAKDAGRDRFAFG